MNAISAALDTLFADPNLGETATWRAGGTGAAVDVRVLASLPDSDISFEGKRLQVETRTVEIRISECPDLAPGDTLTLDGEVCAVLSAPRDEHRLVWIVTLGGDRS